MKNFENVDIYRAFNIKYIVVYDKVENIPELLEHSMHLPWDVREVFKDSKIETIFKCIKEGFIYPNFILVKKDDIEKILREYNQNLFVLIIKEDCVDLECIILDGMLDIIARAFPTIGDASKISRIEVINASSMKAFNISAWLRNRIHHYWKYSAQYYLGTNILDFEKIYNLSENIKEILSILRYLTEEMNKGNFVTSFENKKIDFEKIIDKKSFFKLVDEEKEGLMIQSLEDEYFYYGKYSRVLLRENQLLRQRKTLAMQKISSLHSLAQIKHEIIFPILYAKVKDYSYYALDYDINRIRQELNVITHHCRVNDPSSASQMKQHRKNLSRWVKNLNVNMMKNNGINEIIKHLEPKNSYYKVKVSSSLPLGWLNINGCPLALRYFYSVTPKNKYQNYNTRKLMIVKNDLLKILIIRSFYENDKLKYLMENSLKHFTKKINLQKVSTELTTHLPDDVLNQLKDEKNKTAQYRFVDIDSEEKLIETINTCEEKIIIFDCHGVKLDNQGNYGLHLYGKEVNLENFKSKIIKFPPIVIFSSCDSLPLNANQNQSPAQSVIDLGARVVIGTYLPINGLSASIEISRLIYRLEKFVEIELKKSNAVDFSTIFHGWLLMGYTREILYYMRDDNLFDKKMLKKIHLAVNLILNPLHPNWFEQFLNILFESIEKFTSKEQIIEYLWTNIAVTDSMKYVCMGYPENVFLTKDINISDSRMIEIAT